MWEWLHLERFYLSRSLRPCPGIDLIYAEYHSPSCLDQNPEILPPMNLSTLVQNLTQKVGQKMLHRTRFFPELSSWSQHIKWFAFMHSNVCDHWGHWLVLPRGIRVLLSLHFLKWIFPRIPQNFEFLNMIFLSSLMSLSHSMTPIALLKDLVWVFADF